METRVAIIGIIIEDVSAAPQVQALLSQYADYIFGRMGIPYAEKSIRVISVAIDAPMDIINALTGKIGRVNGVSAKTVYQSMK